MRNRYNQVQCNLLPSRFEVGNGGPGEADPLGEHRLAQSGLRPGDPDLPANRSVEVTRSVTGRL
jgi:hypothetical protein